MVADRPDPDDFVPGPSSADALNQLPRGCIAAEESSANGAGTTTLETIIDFDVTVPAGRRIRLIASVSVTSNITGGVQASLWFDGVQRQRRNIDTFEGGSYVTFELIKDVQPDAGTFSCALVVGASGIAGNTVTAAANGQTGTRGVSTLYVDDVGPALA